MNGIILYESKYGATKKYVDWLREETDFDVMKTKKATMDDVLDYDVIVLAGGIYASGITGLSFFRSNIKKLKDKHLFILCDGASPYDEDTVSKLVEANLKKDLEGIPCYYCRGAWNLNKMNFIDRNLCKLLKKSLDKKDPSTYEVWEKALVDAFDEVCDWCSKEQLEPLLTALHKFDL